MSGITVQNERAKGGVGKESLKKNFEFIEYNNLQLHLARAR